MTSTAAAPIAAPFEAAASRRWDGGTLLTIYLFLLLAIPSDRYVPGLGAAGSPATLFGLAAMVWWFWHQLRRGRTIGEARPVRGLVGIFFEAVMISYLVANLRAIPAVEIGPADNGVLRVLSWAGILLVANDGIPTFERLTVFLRRLVVGATLVAVVGIAEFFLKTSLVANIPIPGLVASSDYSDVVVRGQFVRTFATAQHPLEYAMLLAMVLPIAMTLALYDRGGRRAFPWICAGVILLALVTSGSRSAIIGIVLAIIPLVPAWSWRVRGVMAAAGAVASGLIYVLIPGIAGTITYLFVNVGTDSSAESRADSVGTFAHQFAISPIFGRGLGTFLPMYRIFDNQYLGLLVEVGIVGTAAFVALLLIPAVLAVITGARIPPAADLLPRKLGTAFAGSALVALVLDGFFDAFSFPKAVGITFLVVGLAGAYLHTASRTGHDALSLADTPALASRDANRGPSRAGAPR